MELFRKGVLIIYLWATCGFYFLLRVYTGYALLIYCDVTRIVHNLRGYIYIFAYLLIKSYTECELLFSSLSSIFFFHFKYLSSSSELLLGALE